MKKKYLFILLFAFNSVISDAQPTTAMDFSMVDCNGQFHNLYSELDSGNAIIMEFWMDNCQPCVDAGIALEAMYQNLKTTVCGNKVRYFQTVFNDNDHCNVVNSWIAANGFSSAPFDSGAAQITYYGGFGMPTVAVAAGNTHQLLYLCKQGFPINDTSVIAAAIRSFCTSGAGVSENDFHNSMIVSPNPTEGKLKVQSSKFKVQGFEIYNAVGEKVNSSLSPCPLSFEIDLSSYHNGIYFLKINVAQGFIRKKIVVSK